MNNEDFITADELFFRISEILDTIKGGNNHVNRPLHTVLELACKAGINEDKKSFGNIFSIVDYLGNKYNMRVPDIIAIQKMRRDTNHTANISKEDLMYDIRALCTFISTIFSVDIPSAITPRIPASFNPKVEAHHIDYRYIRCIVKSWDDDFITADADISGNEQTIKIDYSSEHLQYLKDILKEGMQLNLLDVEEMKPSLIIIEPDFLLDISAIARCFTDYGHNALAYTVNRMTPVANTQAILLGNFAGQALDDIINRGDDYDWRDTFRSNFKDKVMEYSTCRDLNKKDDFRTAALNQAKNIQEIVDELFNNEGYNRTKTILEPSFVCEQLGLQGRVDLMTTDFHLLVEQKSGGNYNIQRNFLNKYGSYQKEEHYVQLLLYYGILHYNFHLGNNTVNARLLYSKYPLPGGLVVVNFYQSLFREAIKFRNMAVAKEYGMAQEGFNGVMEDLSPETLNENGCLSKLFMEYQRPQIEKVTRPLHELSSLEHAYFSRMMTFVYREELASRIGATEGQGNCIADMWNMPLTEKIETGNIYTALRITNKKKSNEYNGFDTITLTPQESSLSEEVSFLPNFRKGDSIYLYSYKEGEEPDARRALLFKGSLIGIKSDELIVHLNDGQQNPNLFKDELYAIEHSSSDGNTSSAIRSLHRFISAPKDLKDLLLCQCQPQQDKSLTLTKSYSPNLDETLLKAKQAKDYFLLIGPPGTGKTSMTLRFMVQEELTQPDANLLLMSYTNRAVDEICDMLVDAGLDFMRIGNVYSSDERFKDYFIDAKLGDNPKLSDMKQTIIKQRIIVGTTSTMQNRSYIFELKHFSLAIIDESSQILEPNIIGLLADIKSKFILIGDYKQLPAVVQQDAAASSVEEPLLLDICLDNCRDSLFERLIKAERKAGRKDFIGILHHQGRMHPDIAEFPNKMFYFHENLEPVPCPHQLERSLKYDKPSEDNLDDALKQHRMIFISSKPCRSTELSDKVNISEAKIVAELLKRIYRFYGDSFNAQKTVGVIIPYRNQIAMIRKEIEKLGIPALENVSIDTIERYQGSQRDVIIYSFTIQNRYQLNFLTSNCFEEGGHIIDRKLNVAITRARKQMIMTGNVRTLLHNRTFKQLIRYTKECGKYIDFLDLD